MTSALWEIIAKAVRASDDVPGWLKEQVRLSFNDTMRLPTLDEGAYGDDSVPKIEKKIVTSDYLNFLREQIDLESRGPEWTEILKKRLALLEPYVSKELITVMFFRKPNSVTIQINPDNHTIIRVEK